MKNNRNPDASANQKENNDENNQLSSTHCSRLFRAQRGDSGPEKASYTCHRPQIDLRYEPNYADEEDIAGCSAHEHAHAHAHDKYSFAMNEHFPQSFEANDEYFVHDEWDDEEGCLLSPRAHTQNQRDQRTFSTWKKRVAPKKKGDNLENDQQNDGIDYFVEDDELPVNYTKNYGNGQITNERKVEIFPSPPTLNVTEKKEMIGDDDEVGDDDEDDEEIEWSDNSLICGQNSRLHQYRNHRHENRQEKQRRRRKRPARNIFALIVARTYDFSRLLAGVLGRSSSSSSFARSKKLSTKTTTQTAPIATTKRKYFTKTKRLRTGDKWRQSSSSLLTSPPIDILAWILRHWSALRHNVMSSIKDKRETKDGNDYKGSILADFMSRTSLNWSSDSKESFYRPNGIHWITAALFIVADMAGGGVVAMPIAMLKSGGVVGSIVIALIGAAFCYTAHLLGQNWLLMCERWPSVYGGSAPCIPDNVNGNDDGYGNSNDPNGDANTFAHCRKPYPEMALRSMGERAQFLTSITLNVMLYGVSIVYLLLSSKIISDFMASAFDVHMGQCSMVLIVSLSLLPVTFLKSPQDFWWAVVTAMVTTAIAVALILAGTIMDAPICAPHAKIPDHFQPNQFLLSLGIFMFAFGGHGVFPTIQHDMKRPQQFTSSAILAFAIVFIMYIPITLLGYMIYGDSLQDSIINSIQIPSIQVAANLCIAIHCILTLTIVINPLNQQFEHILRSPHQFGWRRVLIRTSVMALIVFSAETVPSFGPILNLIGGTLVALSSAVLPCLFNLFMGARYGGRLNRFRKVSEKSIDKFSTMRSHDSKESIGEPPIPTFREVIRNTPSTTLVLNLTVIGYSASDNLWRGNHVVSAARRRVQYIQRPMLHVIGGVRHREGAANDVLWCREKYTPFLRQRLR